MVLLIALGCDARGIKSIDVQDRYGDNCPLNDLRSQDGIRLDARGIKSTNRQGVSRGADATHPCRLAPRVIGAHLVFWIEVVVVVVVVVVPSHLS